MSSPFPGMDPYLEGSLWTTVHTQLAVAIAHQLTPQLRPGYLALNNERFVIVKPSRDSSHRGDLYQDVSIAGKGGNRSNSGGTAVMEAPLRIASVLPEPIPHVSVEIRDRMKRRLVAVIELLSPTNKRGLPHKKYLARRDRILHSNAHLLEIDLLRTGRRIPLGSELPDYAYFVFLNRSESRWITETWPIDMRQPLPAVPVPLLPGDADACLDLQKAFTSMYDAGGYDMAIDYLQPPEIPFTEGEAVWANTLFSAQNLNPTTSRNGPPTKESRP